MDSMIDELRKYLETHTPEQIQEDWDKSKLSDEVGPTMEDYSKFLREQIKLDNNEKVI